MNIKHERLSNYTNETGTTPQMEEKGKQNGGQLPQTVACDKTLLNYSLLPRKATD